MIVKSIGVLSVGKLLGCLYALLGLVFGAGFFFFTLVAAVLAGGNAGPAMFFGVAAIVVAPLAYGLMGFIAGVIMAVLYNFVASIAGGIEIELTSGLTDRTG